MGQMYLHDKLVCAADELELVGVIEHFRDVVAERVASAAWRHAPAGAIIGIRPQQVAHRTLKNIALLTSGTATEPSGGSDPP